MWLHGALYHSSTNLNAKFKQGAQTTTWSKVSLFTLKACIGHVKAECKCSRLLLEWKYRALKSKREKTRTRSSISAPASSPSSSSPVTAAQEGARRPFGPTELAGAGRVFALCNEHVQIGDAYLLLSLGLWGR